MKKPIIVSVIMALVLLAGGFFAPVHAQDPAKEEKPTFYRLIPGVYVNGWPRFTIHYPKDWVERYREPLLETFRASVPGPVPYPFFLVAFGIGPLALETTAENLVSLRRRAATDVSIVSDKPSQLQDGTPAREVELRFVLNGIPFHNVALATKKGDLWTMTVVWSDKGRVREDLKAILYSRQNHPGKEEPVKVPPDIQEFLDRYCSDLVSHDVERVMAHYSDRFLDSGIRKGEMERNRRREIGLVSSYELGITEFVIEGDKVHLTGFVLGPIPGKWPLGNTTIIKENGEWKWYGNQRDVSP
jgi:hypothetical protein